MTPERAPAAAPFFSQACVPLVALQRTVVEALDLPPADKRPEPDCDTGGPHRYPPGRETACRVCGITPGAAAVEGLRRAEAAARLREAFG